MSRVVVVSMSGKCCLHQPAGAPNSVLVQCKSPEGMCDGRKGASWKVCECVGWSAVVGRVASLLCGPVLCRPVRELNATHCTRCMQQHCCHSVTDRGLKAGAPGSYVQPAPD